MSRRPHPSLITLKMLDEEYKLRSSSLCNFLCSPVEKSSIISKRHHYPKQLMLLPTAVPLHQLSTQARTYPQPSLYISCLHRHVPAHSRPFTSAVYTDMYLPTAVPLHQLSTQARTCPQPSLYISCLHRHVPAHSRPLASAFPSFHLFPAFSALLSTVAITVKLLLFVELSNVAFSWFQSNSMTSWPRVVSSWCVCFPRTGMTRLTPPPTAMGKEFVRKT
jgi:hypothetical protein